MTTKDISDIAFDIVKEMAEVDEDGTFYFRGLAVDVIEAIKELDSAESKLSRLLPDAIEQNYIERTKK